MFRYFLEVAYCGTNYSGFQIQKNAITIQESVEKALSIYFKQKIDLTGSSRTDSGVHALQNFFHFNINQTINPKIIYNLNAILPNDIAIKNIISVNSNAHCRFSALSREYHYIIYQHKNPFLLNKAWYYPYKLNLNLLQQASEIIKNTTDFTTFSKRHTQVNNFNCQIIKSYWEQQENTLVYKVVSNRFLRGMVRGLVSTMLDVGTTKISLQQLNNIVSSHNCNNANFSAPAQGLYLIKVEYPSNIFI
jgi:tRNA pseudouridine38-40 synthase